MFKDNILQKDKPLNNSELLDRTLKIYKNARNNKEINFDRFVSEVLNKDNMGKERLEVYKLNNFLDSAYRLFKGKVNQKQYMGIIDGLIGYEFSIILDKYFLNLGASNIILEEPLQVKNKKTSVDVVAQFDKNVDAEKLLLVNPDMTKINLQLQKGKIALEAKAREKVSNDDITRQLKLMVDSKRYTNCYGVILNDTTVSRDVVKEIYRVGAKLIKVSNISKNDVIKNVLNIYG